MDENPGVHEKHQEYCSYKLVITKQPLALKDSVVVLHTVGFSIEECLEAAINKVKGEIANPFDS